MKKGLQKSLALLLAVFMTFGVAPVMGFGLLVSAADPVLTDIEIVPSAVTLTKVGQTMTMTVSPIWKDDVAGTFNTDDVTWVSSDVSYLTVSDQGVIKVVKLPTGEDKTKDITVTAKYISSSGNGAQQNATATVTLKQLEPDNRNLTGMTVTPDSLTLTNVGDTYQLHAVGTYKDEPAPYTVTKGVTWGTSDDKIVKVSSTGLVEVVSVPASNASDVTVTITAVCEGADGKLVSAKCVITVPKKHIYVERLNLDWAATALVSELNYKFENVFTYTLYLSETPPADVEVNRNVTLTCSPADALVIDNEKKTIQVLPISKDTLVVTLTLTAEDPSPNCKPVTMQVTIYKDVPLTGIKWDYKLGSTGKTRLAYYEKVNGINRIAEYYYEETVGTTTTYKYNTTPAYARDVCEIKVKSSDTRVLRVDEKTNRLIPVGNGEAQLTITATTPKGVSKSDTIIVVVNDSPYNPITDVKIGYDEKTATNASYNSESNTLSISYKQGITLKALLTPTEAKLDQKDVYVTTTDNRKIKTVSATEYTWSSSNPEAISVNSKGEVKVNKAGSAVITLTVNDNGVEFKKTVNVKGSMTTWQVVLAILISIFTLNWSKIPGYFSNLF